MSDIRHSGPVSDDVPHRLVIGGAALIRGVLALHAAPVVRVFRGRLDGAVETEGVEEGEKEQQTDDTKDDDNQDGVHLHVHLLPREQRGGDGGAQEAGGRRGRAGRRSHGG